MDAKNEQTSVPLQNYNGDLGSKCHGFITDTLTFV